jgi:PleD family two-component response regulator
MACRLYGLSNQVGLALAQGQLQRVREEAATDPLTGLLNRRAILGELGAYVARAARSRSRVAVLFCDLDGFKAINDRAGHEAGDAVLRDIATRSGRRYARVTSSAGSAATSSWSWRRTPGSATHGRSRAASARRSSCRLARTAWT